MNEEQAREIVRQEIKQYIEDSFKELNKIATQQVEDLKKKLEDYLK